MSGIFMLIDLWKSHRGLNLQPYMSVEPEDGPAIYDLYGVINHMGRLLGGHYTAYARLLSTQDTRRSDIGV